MDKKFYYFLTSCFDSSSLDLKKIIYSGYWCFDNYYKYQNKKKKINNFLINSIWSQEKSVKSDYLYIKILLKKYSTQISKNLNKVHKINESQKFWNILILPWLVYYVSSNLYRWRIVEKALKISKGKLIFIDFNKNSDLENPVNTTIDFCNFAENSEAFNHKLFKKIIFFKKKEFNIKTLNNKKYLNHYHSKEKINFFSNIKFFIFKLLDKVLINFSKKNSFFLEKKIFSFLDYIILSLKLKQFPLFLFFNFNYKSENLFLKNTLVNKNLRNNFVFKNSKNVFSFESFLNANLGLDIPTCYIERFQYFKDLSKNINITPKVILSSYNWIHNEKFKFWTAYLIKTNNAKLIYAEHGGGEQNKYNGAFRISNILSHKRITWTKPQFHKDVQLPALSLSKRKNKKNKIYLSYVENPQTQYSNKIYSDTNSFQNIENILVLKKKLNPTIYSNLRYLSSGSNVKVEREVIKEIIGDKLVEKPRSLKKYLPMTKITICNYTETAFTESVLNGPTLLVKNKFLSLTKIDQKNLKKLFKLKILFLNMEDAINHINLIWYKPNIWWNKPDVKNTIKTIINNFVKVDPNYLNTWFKFLNNQK